ncbi:hypothetical protein ACIA5D_17760 [Actinoplanes sp. NPDC051513]|uniref:hypothetical protein n=1 Tax=Actinoplanes sp. NPDC051513 TaxID=3363908 RepID=UPI0037ABC769
MARQFPAPLVQAPRPRPILPGRFWAVPDGLRGWFVKTPDGTAGHAFPKVVGDPDGEWFGRRTGASAQRRDDDVSALAHVVGCDPGDIRFEAA